MVEIDELPYCSKTKIVFYETIYIPLYLLRGPSQRTKNIFVTFLTSNGHNHYVPNEIVIIGFQNVYTLIEKKVCTSCT